MTGNWEELTVRILEYYDRESDPVKKADAREKIVSLGAILDEQQEILSGERIPSMAQIRNPKKEEYYNDLRGSSE